MEIIEGNKLIAEFMGFRIDYHRCYHPKEYGHLPSQYTDIKGENKQTNIEHLQFHKSWDWLMPVVEKIELGNYGFKMCRKVVEIYFDDTKEVVLKVKEKSRLESLWKVVVQFIQWYNTQPLTLVK